MTDPLTSTARFLADHVEWMRHRPEADEFLASIEAASRLITGIIDGAPPRLYLGPCGAAPPECNPIRHAEDCPEDCGLTECAGDVYARQGQRLARCRSCGAEVDVADRKAWLDETVRETLFRAVHIADAYSINVNTIRSWYARGRLAAHGEEDGKPTFRVGEVLDLAAADALRRAENEAKRAQKEMAA